MPRPITRSTSASTQPRHQHPAGLAKFLFGVAYYPEHWPRAYWRRDFARMRAHGVKVLRIGEFAWDVWEPSEGRYDFALFDEVIALAGRHGLEVILGTPTAGAPRWLSVNHPEWLRHTEQGVQLGHNGRQQLSFVTEAARAHCRKLAEALASHYANNPRVIGWQVDNEQHCVCAFDFSPAAAAAFQDWLRARHGSIARLNRAWGTAFSAQSYRAFAEVPLPLCNRPDGFPPHPSHLLEYYRWLSDVAVRFLGEQAAILKRHNPAWTVLHNGLFSHLDYWKLAGRLDVLGVDIYPGFGGTDGSVSGCWTAYKLEECRAHSGTFVVPELASGAAGLQTRFVETPEPGQMRLWAWQCVAHGADGIFHFRWRTCRSGWEIYWHGVLDHDNQPRRRLEELAREAGEFQRIGTRLLGAVREVEIGILIDFEQDDAHEATLAAYPAPKLQAEHLLGALLNRHLAAGLIHARDSFAGLRTLIVPSFGCLTPELVQKLEAFVNAGGQLIVTARSGVRDSYNKALPQSGPGPLARLLACRVQEHGGFREPFLEIATDAGARYPGGMGYEILTPRGARVLARWVMPSAHVSRQPHPAAGQAAITQARSGKGRATLLGCWLDAKNTPMMCDWLAEVLGWQSAIIAAKGVEVTRRRKDARSYCFVLNHTAERQEVSGLRAGRDLISGQTITDRLTLAAYDVAVIAEDRKQ